MAVRQTYRSEAEFLTAFNPSKQVAYTKDVARAFLGKAPSLGLLAKAFGPNTRDAWLDIQLTDLAVFSGCKEKFSEGQTEQLVDIIAEEYGHLKVTELMYFFRRFKSGDYGRFYGTVDPLVVTCALREFADERLAILNRLEREERERKERAEPSDAKFRNAYHAAARKQRFYSLNFRSPDFTYEEFAGLWWLFNLGYERKGHGYEE